ncbi:MAG: tRNA (adenosine(37)-N6)-dimethylallyltransferase MiaA [Christiangramia sp.]|uniref:tRNA (adenosine(37)-N6)-dimethylallyltransferase MiaA n=1 Tax=Christiangramia sp. TaxID=1931228 RepID=UPI003241CBE5
MPKYLITISGPTAIGKTAISIELARHFQTEILSADSRQFFQELKIGTAVPEPEELDAAPHHFIQHISITENYSVGDFERDAIRKLEEIYQKQDMAIMVGGSGLYLKAITEGLDDFPEVDPAIRVKLKQQLEEEGIDRLQKELFVLDPDYYRTADVQNPHRLIRALEICIGTGKTFSSFLNKPKKPRDFTVIPVGLTAEREVIYERINRRVDLMMKKGLLEEARKVYPQRELNALNTVGYKELFEYFGGKWDLETAVSEIKKNTRRFAKRQLTWFRKDERINWFDYQEDPKKIIDFIESRISS